jgi:sortase A
MPEQSVSTTTSGPDAVQAPGPPLLEPGAPRRARSPRWAERLLLLIALICLGTVAYSTLDAKIFQAIEARRLEQELTRQPVPELPPDEGPSDRARRAALPPLDVAPGEPLGRIEIPRLGVSVIVSEGLDRKTLRRAVGHIPGTAFPGDLGNVGIAGHRDSFFRPLKDVQVGDEVVLTTPRGRFRYVVEETEIVRPNHVEVLDPTEEPTLTLVTCYPFYYVGSAPKRFIVQAREVALENPAG